MRLLICGDRNWMDADAIRREVLVLMDVRCPIQCVIEGEARGADTLGRLVAEELGIPVLRFPADWKRYGRGAGPVRNQQMLSEGRPTFVLAFHPDITQSKGTGDMLRRVRAAGIPCKVVPR